MPPREALLLTPMLATHLPLALQNLTTIEDASGGGVALIAQLTKDQLSDAGGLGFESRTGQVTCQNFGPAAACRPTPGQLRQHAEPL